MKLFDRVVVVCDQTPDMLEMANAARALLECFGLRVDFHHLIQKRQVLEFFARPQDCDYTVLFTHGENGRQLTIHVVDQIDDDYSQRDGWNMVDFALTPAVISDIIRGQRGTPFAGIGFFGGWLRLLYWSGSSRRTRKRRAAFCGGPVLSLNG